MLRPLDLRQLAGGWVHLHRLCSEQAMLGKYTDESNLICGGTATFSNQDPSVHNPNRTTLWSVRTLPCSRHVFMFVCVWPDCF